MTDAKERSIDFGGLVVEATNNAIRRLREQLEREGLVMVPGSIRIAPSEDGDEGVRFTCLGCPRELLAGLTPAQCEEIFAMQRHTATLPKFVDKLHAMRCDRDEAYLRARQAEAEADKLRGEYLRAQDSIAVLREQNRDHQREISKVDRLTESLLERCERAEADAKRLHGILAERTMMLEGHGWNLEAVLGGRRGGKTDAMHDALAAMEARGDAICMNTPRGGSLPPHKCPTCGAEWWGTDVDCPKGCDKPKPAAIAHADRPCSQCGEPFGPMSVHTCRAAKPMAIRVCLDCIEPISNDMRRCKGCAAAYLKKHQTAEAEAKAKAAREHEQYLQRKRDQPLPNTRAAFLVLYDEQLADEDLAYRGEQGRSRCPHHHKDGALYFARRYAATEGEHDVVKCYHCGHAIRHALVAEAVDISAVLAKRRNGHDVVDEDALLHRALQLANERAGVPLDKTSTTALGRDIAATRCERHAAAQQAALARRSRAAQQMIGDANDQPEAGPAPAQQAEQAAPYFDTLHRTRGDRKGYSDALVARMGEAVRVARQACASLGHVREGNAARPSFCLHCDEDLPQ